MNRLQAYKFELMPDGEQRSQMARFAGSCRFVYNEAQKTQKLNYEAGGKFIRYEEMAKRLTAWRNGDATPWLKDAPVHPLQHALKDLDRAYKSFFEKRMSFPKFKRRGDNSSFRYPDPKQFELDQANARIKLPKLGWIRYRKSRDVVGELRNVTVSKSGDRWFCSVQTEREVEPPIHSSTTAIGVDVGIARFATMSDASFIAPVNSFRKHEARLRRYQRAMRRKVKFSQNWKKARAKVQRVHARIGNVRRDFLHKASTALCQQHALICIEDLRVKNMSASAAGTTDAPGRNVRQKSGLNKSILG